VTVLRSARRPRDRDEGQILLLGIAYGLLALALVLVVASASAVHIERKQLIALADAAALDAADALDAELFYLGTDATTTPTDVSGTDVAVPLTREGVRTAVAAHLEGRRPPGASPGWGSPSPRGRRTV
jgi:uncharacterized membrane protein